MACNSSLQALVSRIPQGSPEGVCATGLIDGLQLQQDSSSSANHTSFTRTDPSEGPAGFLSLARELRDMIYTDLITSGNVAILRVSRQLHDEVKENLPKEGIFRIHLNSPISGPSVLAINNKIQNFNILMYLPDILRYPEKPFLNKHDKLKLEYLQSCQGSGACHITLIFQITDGLGLHPRVVASMIRTLSSFKLVALRIHITYESITIKDCTCKWMKANHKHLLETLASSLQPTLGYPDRKPDSCPSPRHQTSTYARAQPDVSPFPNAQYLEFHPRERSERPQTGSTNGEAEA